MKNINKKRIILSTATVLLGFFAFILSSFAYEMSSTNYRILESSINVGGQDIQTSTSYMLRESIGDVVAGEATSTSYILRTGYQPMLETYISLSVSTTSVQMLPNISGMSGGAATGTFFATVATDNPAGYSLYVSASTSPALMSGSNSFADYSPGEAAWYAGYSYRKKITIDEAKIDSDLTDFPVLVSLSSSTFDFTKARSDGYDIRFTSDDGKTLLEYERERHDSTSSVAEYWVKIPSVSSSASTSFYLYYGKASDTDGAEPNNVWDDYNVLVQHLEESPANGVAGHIDSTSYSNNGTPYNFDGTATSTTNGTGKIDGANVFDRTNDIINVPSTAGDELDITSSFTIEAWIKTSDCAPISGLYPQIVCRRDYGGWGSYLLEVRSTGFVDVVFDAAQRATGDINVCNGDWRYVVGVHDDLADITSIFIDGNLDASSSVATNPTSGNNELRIGAYSSGAGGFKGTIDEVRISNTPRSAAWIKASYNSGNNSLLSFGSEAAEADIVPDFSWSILSAGSEFGFSPEGSDIIQKFKDNGSDTCATGTSDTADKCWINFSTSNQMISRVYSANHPLGTQTMIKLKAESGASNVQAMGIYMAHIITTVFGN